MALKQKEKNYINPDSIINESLSVQIISNSHYFTEYIDGLAKALEKRNIKVNVGDSFNPDILTNVVIYVGATVREIKQIKEARNKGIVVATILTEQPTSRQVGFFTTGKKMIKRDKRILPLADVAYVWSTEQYEAYCDIHDHVVLLPYAYIPELDYTERFGKLEKEYDILFLGDSDRPHRDILLSKLSDKYNVLTTSFANNSLWGEEKYKAIHQSKICLNIHQESGLIMEKPRMFEYFSNGAFVLSESMRWTEPFVKGEDFDTFYYSDIIDKVDYYLTNDAARENIAQNAYQKVKKLSMSDSADILLDGILMELSYRAYKREQRDIKNCLNILLKPYRYLKWWFDSLNS